MRTTRAWISMRRCMSFTPLVIRCHSVLHVDSSDTEAENRAHRSHSCDVLQASPPAFAVESLVCPCRCGSFVPHAFLLPSRPASHAQQQWRSSLKQRE
jgi:hypothetical protein